MLTIMRIVVMVLRQWMVVTMKKIFMMTRRQCSVTRLVPGDLPKCGE